MDRRSRACMLMAIFLHSTWCRSLHGMCGPTWPDCGHPKHGPATKHAEEERSPGQQGHGGLGVSCLRVIGKKDMPCQRGSWGVGKE